MDKAYISENGLEAGIKILDIHSIDLRTELEDLVSAEKNKSLRVVYDSLYRMGLLGNTTFMWTYNLTLKNYRKERIKFINVLYFKISFNLFNEVFREHLLNEIEKPKRDELRIVKWWRSYKLIPTLKDYLRNRLEFYASNATDVKSAKKFAFTELANNCISNWIDGNEQQKTDAQQDYAHFQMNKVYDFPPTLKDLVSEYFTPLKVLPVEQAVLNTSPRILFFNGSCFASSYFQCITNFLPLFQKSSCWNGKNHGPKIQEHKKIISKVAEIGDNKPLNVRAMMTFPSAKTRGSSPSRLLIRFLSDAAANGLGLNQLFGMVLDDGVNPRQLFPPWMMFHSLAAEELQKVRMVGQLFITWIPAKNNSQDGKDPSFYEPVELPTCLDLKVIESEQPKRFQLYSFIMGQNMSIAHVVAYIRRADDHWWFCDDLSGSSKNVDTDKVPYTIENQKILSQNLLQRPVMAFYLRVEQ